MDNELPSGSEPPFACRSCGRNDISVFLRLGNSPLANAILSPGETDEEPTFPLDVGVCRNCSLVQLSFAPPPDALFRDYPYFSSFSDTMVEHAGHLAKRLIEERRLTSRSLVVELASNDGYLLQFYRDAGIPVLGIEPALNIARVAEQRGIPTIGEFFGSELGRTLADAGRQADVVHAHNVLAHVPDLNGFVEGIVRILKPAGTAVIEAPYVGDLIARTEFDTIYHEHLSYFSLTALVALFSRHSLTIVDVERVPIHGGSLRIFAQRACSEITVSPRVVELLEDEETRGMASEDYYSDFGSSVRALKEELVSCLSELKACAKQIAGYGASAKGTTLLTYCGIGANYLDFLVDRSTAKQGHLAPGSHLPIHPPSELLRAMPDYTLLLVWNFADEILDQQREYRTKGGKFIVPVPSVRII